LWLVSALHWPMGYGYLVGFILGAAATLASAILPPWLVRAKVDRLGDI
jgi:hypothetical protein